MSREAIMVGVLYRDRGQGPLIRRWDPAAKRWRRFDAGKVTEVSAELAAILATEDGYEVPGAPKAKSKTRNPGGDASPLTEPAASEPTHGGVDA